MENADAVERGKTGHALIAARAVSAPFKLGIISAREVS
tara:strand:- start:502 stop:615 length:114 start_codon:yes stop_codon:yes gene_type:complete